VNANFAGEIDAWYAQVAAVADQMNLMTYDMAGPWGGWVSWHHSALGGHGGTHPSSVQGSVAAYRAAGVPAAKLGIGLGFYGSCWRGVTAPLQLLGAGATLVASDNAMSYRNIMEQYHTSSAYRWDATASVPYLSFGSPKGPQGCTFVSYENAESVAAKAAWARTEGLGGAIVWTIAQGHLPNAAEKNPLLRAGYEALIVGR
jgi:chitinase